MVALGDRPELIPLDRATKVLILGDGKRLDDVMGMRDPHR